jgi:hypothetical protein
MPIQKKLTRSLKRVARPATYKTCIVIADGLHHMKKCLMQKPVPDHVLPPEGYVVEVGGEFSSEYGSLTAALKAGLELKNKNSHIQVKVYDAKERPPAALSARSE